MPYRPVAVSLARGAKLSGSKTQVSGASAVPIASGGGPCAKRLVSMNFRAIRPLSSSAASACAGSSPKVASTSTHSCTGTLPSQIHFVVFGPYFFHTLRPRAS